MAGLKPCAVCGTPIDPDRAYLSGDGPVCDACQTQGELDRDFAAAARYYPFTSLGLALVGLVFNPFFLMTIGACSVAITGVLKLTVLGVSSDYSRALGGKRTAYVLGCIAAVLLSLVPVILRIVLLGVR
jgi:hypothetical protein